MPHPRPSFVEVLDERAQMFLARALRTGVLEERDPDRSGRLDVAGLEALSDLAVLDGLLLQLLVLDRVERRCSVSQGQRRNQSETGGEPEGSHERSPSTGQRSSFHTSTAEGG